MVYPQGENALTVRNGKRSLLKALLDKDAKRFDQLRGDDEVAASPETSILARPAEGALQRPVFRFWIGTHFGQARSSKARRLRRACYWADFDGYL